MDGLNSVTEIGRRTFYRGKFKYIGNQDFTYVTMDIVDEDEHYRLDATYNPRNLEKLF